MTRAIARARPVWAALLGLVVLALLVDVAVVVAGGPGLLPGGSPAVFVGIGAVVGCVILIGVAPRAGTTEAHELAAPVRGTWTAVNSPGQRLPSHGTRTRGQFCAVDVCGVTSPDDPPLVGWMLRGSRPEAYACFGAPVHAMADGEVVAARDGRRDHRSRNTWQALAFMLTVEGLLREVAGTGAILGNHVVIAHGDGTFAAYAHLRRGSVAVRVGQQVAVGEQLGLLGNTGNTSMPHLHVQLMDRADLDAAAGLVMTWPDASLSGELDPAMARWAKEPHASAIAGMPRNCEVFTV